MIGLSATERPLQMYRPHSRNWYTATFMVRAAAGVDPPTLLPQMRDVARSQDREFRIDRLVVAQDMMRDTLEQERFTSTLMTGFAVLALILAAVGLFGVVSQVVGQRTHEIGIRMALGARGSRIAGLILGRVGVATAVGIAMGLILGVVGGRVLGSRIEGLVSASAWSFVSSAGLLALVSLAAGYLPARKAARTDPVEAMRVE